MSWRERIVVDPGVLVGKPIVKGTRICVELVIEFLARGSSQAQIPEQDDRLAPEDIRGCLAYASEVLRSEKVAALP